VSEDVSPAAAEVPAAPLRARLWRGTTRLVRWVLAAVAAVVATSLILVFTVDLGRFPQLKARAERAASDYLGRPMRIGHLSATIAPGLFALDDVVIEGRRPGDLPFFQAGRIWVYVPWWTLFQNQLHVELGLTDWRMVVETWRDGHNVPRLTPRSSGGGSRMPFTTTVRYVYANRGAFIFNDHATPWSVQAPNLQFSLARAENLRSYVGRAEFSGGTVQIQQFKPMAAALTTRFTLDGPRVLLRHIDLTTDGSVSHVNGMVDFSRWPEQTYNVNSTIDFPRMKEIFFANESWRLGGEGQFTGVFRFFRNGRELAGDFDSSRAVVNDLVFDDLHGSLIWTPERFAVTHADADILGGRTRFDYSIAPLGRPGGSTQSFSAEYADLDLTALGSFMSLKSLAMAGRATGNIALDWPSGRFRAGRRGGGHTVVTPPAGMEIAPIDLPAVPRPAADEPKPFVSDRPLPPIALAADVDYDVDPDGWTFTESWAATPHTYVAFAGRLASSGASEFPFHVTSHDWQESDRLLARIMTAVAGPTRAIEVGGRGTFDGTMTGSFSAPRIAGRFTGQDTRVWDVTWGRGVADAVISGGYVDISNGRFGDSPDASITADGRFALGFRRDGAQEIDARVTMKNWPMADLRHAFGLDDWRVDGTVAETTLGLKGHYRSMFGSGRVRVERGTAWGERFEQATGDIELEGSGMRIHRFEMMKSSSAIRGDVRVGWDGTYNFDVDNLDGEVLPIESLEAFRFPQAPITGGLRFEAEGRGAFSNPSYEFHGWAQDFFVADQGIGYVDGRLTVVDNKLIIPRMFADSPLLHVEARGEIALNERYDSELHFNFVDSSIDPYLRFFAQAPAAFNRFILSGSLDVAGPLRAPHEIAVAAVVDDATLTMFDYDLKNDGPVNVAFKNDLFEVGRLKLIGADTNLELTGGADAGRRLWNLSAKGAASLSILKFAFPEITTSGSASLNASLVGSFDAPSLTGEAVVSDGRLRPPLSAHGIEAVNGRFRFEESGVNLTGVTGRLAGGDVVFGGSIVREGYRLTEFNLTASGRSMRLRYPSGFSSTVNMDLALLGPIGSPRLSGTVDVLRMSLTASGDSGLLGLATGTTVGGGVTATTGPPTPESQQWTDALMLDIEVTAPRMTFVDTREARRIEGTADLRLSGTFNRPIMTGSVEILGGEALIAGNRVFIRESSIDFRNTERIEPYFDFNADTRVRTPGQTVDIGIRITGPPSALNPTFTSDPPLPTTDIISLLAGGTADLDTASQRALSSPQESQQRMMQTTAALLLASPISSRVGSVLERTGALDVVQITPLLAGEVAFQQLNPSARITLGRRVSARVFLTYSRTLGNSATQDEVILLEYDQNDRVSWILSRNENRTFALDFRIRYVH
jgi:hypothetical protein